MTSPTEDKDAILDFESTINELEKLVKEFENDKIPLSEGLKKFEKGIELYKQCRSILNHVEEKIKILTDGLKEDDYEK